MAVFDNLYHAGEALAHAVRSAFALPLDVVVVGPPRTEVESTSKHLRISLLWTSEQPTHRNDPPVRNFDGTRTPPPLSLSAVYMLTSYGNTAGEEAVEAHQMLGEAMRVFHDNPELSLPFADLPGRGDGKLGISLMPMAPELLEKVFGPLQIKHRPFALYEVGPVQLRSLKAPFPSQSLVAPDGIRLLELDVQPRPSLERLVPSTQSAGGRIRVDGDYESPPERVWVGSVKLEGALLMHVDGKRSVNVVLPLLGMDAVAPGIHHVSVVANGRISEPLKLRVVAAGEPTLDGPTVLVHSKATNLSLHGRGLSGVTEVVAWPDSGITAPSEVKVFPVAGALSSDTELVVEAPHLNELLERAYRFAARIGAHRYTPYIVLEVSS
jgi:hypothetical protein